MSTCRDWRLVIDGTTRGRPTCTARIHPRHPFTITPLPNLTIHLTPLSNLTDVTIQPRHPGLRQPDCSPSALAWYSYNDVEFCIANQEEHIACEL